MERTAPADDGEFARAGREGLAVSPSHPLAASYLDLLERAGPATQAHEAYVDVQVDRRRAPRLVRAAGGGDEGALAVLRREVAALASSLSGAEVTPERALPPRELARVIRTPSTPEPGAASPGGPPPTPSGPGSPSTPPGPRPPTRPGPPTAGTGRCTPPTGWRSGRGLRCAPTSSPPCSSAAAARALSRSPSSRSASPGPPATWRRPAPPTWPTRSCAGGPVSSRVRAGAASTRAPPGKKPR